MICDYRKSSLYNNLDQTWYDLKQCFCQFKYLKLTETTI